MDSVLTEAGSCGRYQCLHLFFTQLPRFAATWTLFFLVFGGYDPGWRCLGNLSHTGIGNNNNTNSNDDNGNDIITHTTSSVPRLFTLPPAHANNSVFSSNSNVAVTENQGYYDYHYYARINGSVPVLLASDIDTPGEGTLYNGTCDVIDSCIDIEFNPMSRTIVTEFHLVCDRAWVVRIIILIQCVGYLIMPVVVGQVGEKVGRKLSLYACTAILCVFSGVAIFSTHWAMFAICYFFIGGAVNSILGIVPVFATEFLNSKWRGYYCSIPTVALAVILFNVVTLVLKNWVHMHILTFFLSLVACAGFFVVTESPRWLVMNGHVEKAEKSFFRIAKVNKKANIDTNGFKRFLDVTDREVGKTYTLVDVFRTREAFIFIVKCSIIFLLFGVAHMSVTFGVKSLPGDYYTNAIESGCVETVAVILSGPLSNKIGRRFSGLLFGSVGFVSSISMVLTLSFADEGYARNAAIKTFAYFVRGSSQAVAIVSTLLSSELFPTVVRNVSIGLLRSMVGVGGLIAPFLIPAKDAHSMTVCFSVVCVCFAVIAIVFPTFPETNRRNLTDNLNQNQRVLVIEGV